MSVLRARLCLRVQSSCAMSSCEARLAITDSTTRTRLSGPAVDQFVADGIWPLTTDSQRINTARTVACNSWIGNTIWLSRLYLSRSYLTAHDLHGRPVVRLVDCQTSGGERLSFEALRRRRCSTTIVCNWWELSQSA